MTSVSYVNGQNMFCVRRFDTREQAELFAYYLESYGDGTYYAITVVS